ncbi:MAG TPA: GNAT family N-acetyltransferase [Anaerolineales bacterium]|nr:GNAT family N-acetyltransferase [Anaerolineales bacterium]
MTTSNKNIMSKIHYIPTDETSAREFLKWKYEAPYEIYNYDPANYDKDLASHLDPKNNIHSMYRDGELIGYCSFGRDAQVPGGDYSEEAIDIGLMIKPELTGQGQGTGFVANIIQYAIETYKPSKLRVTILDSNTRAKRVWEKNDFQQKQSFERRGDTTLFVILTKDV